MGDEEESMKLVKQVAELMETYNLCDYIWVLCRLGSIGT